MVQQLHDIFVVPQEETPLADLEMVRRQAPAQLLEQGLGHRGKLVIVCEL